MSINQNSNKPVKRRNINSKKFDVLVVGELNVDLILNGLEKYPVAGKEIIANKMDFTLGSSSAIFASNLSTLGPKVAFFGKLGHDSFAEKIITDLRAKNVDVSMIHKTKLAFTGISVAFNYNEDRAMITYPGAMELLSAEEVTDEVLEQAKHLHVSSVFLQPKLKKGIISLFARAKKLGLSTSLDPQWDPSEKWDLDLKKLLLHVDVFLPNIEEIKNLTHTKNKEDAINAIKSFANVVVIKNSNEGAYGWSGEKLSYQPAFINKKVVDAIGAGDSFNAGFIYKFMQDKPLNECLEFGAITGAINTTCAGGTAAFKDKATIKKIAKQKFKYTSQ